MVKIKVTLLMCSLVLFSLIGCDKDEIRGPFYSFKKIEDYSYFKIGTYWVYKDSISGSEDSVYVYTDTSYTYHLGAGSAQKEGDY